MTVLTQLSKAEKMLAGARTAQDVEDVRASAEAARVLAQQMKLGTEAINHATAIKLKAEVRLAGIVDEGQSNGDIATRGQRANVRGPDVSDMTDIGIDRQRLSEARVLARAVDDSVIDKTVDAASAEDVVVTRGAVLTAARAAAIGKLESAGIPAEVVRRSTAPRSLDDARIEKAARALDVLASLPADLRSEVARATAPPILRAAANTVRALTAIAREEGLRDE